MISAIEARDISNKFYKDKIPNIIKDIEHRIKESAKEGRDSIMIKYDKRNESDNILFINMEEVKNRITKLLDEMGYTHQYYTATVNTIELTIKW